MPERPLFDQAAMERALDDLAARLRGADREPPCLIGILTNGLPLARRLAARLNGGTRIDVGSLDITLYRDDLSGRALPLVKGSDVPFDVEGRRIVLVDDVLFTGRTVRAALDELTDFGRPRRVELCVLVDRGHRELPIQADYSGFKVETARADRVRVELTDAGAGADRVLLRTP